MTDVTEDVVSGLGPNLVRSGSPTGIGLVSVLGTPACRATISPNGVAGSGGFGQTKLNTTAPVSGAASVTIIGTAKAFTTLRPTGIAATEGTGLPRLSMVMAPSGVAGGEAFGDADTVATVFIIPGPVDPSNDFGTVTVTRNGWVFRTPRTTYQWRLFKEYEGVSLLREDGVWSEVQHPDLERTLAAQLYLAGGRDHFVDDTTRAELIALGYTVTEELIP